jgi:hypothetical protein
MTNKGKALYREVNKCNATTGSVRWWRCGVYSSQPKYFIPNFGIGEGELQGYSEYSGWSCCMREEADDPEPGCLGSKNCLMYDGQEWRDYGGHELGNSLMFYLASRPAEHVIRGVTEVIDNMDKLVISRGDRRYPESKVKGVERLVLSEIGLGIYHVGKLEGPKRNPGYVENVHKIVVKGTGGVKVKERAKEAIASIKLSEKVAVLRLRGDFRRQEMPETEKEERKMVRKRSKSEYSTEIGKSKDSSGGRRSKDDDGRKAKEVRRVEIEEYNRLRAVWCNIAYAVRKRLRTRKTLEQRWVIEIYKVIKESQIRDRKTKEG